MALLNYSTQIAVSKTAGEIQNMLAKAGAKAIMGEYREGECVALNFAVDTSFGTRGFRLPIDPIPVEKILKQQYARGRLRSRQFTTPDQAARVAWRIVKDWTEAQLALIETEMVTLEQVMLPYMRADGDRTVYELMRDNQLALPPAASEEVLEE